MKHPFYRGKNVLVTGAAGLMGSGLVRALLENGARVRAACHRKPAVVVDPAVENVVCELTKKEGCFDAARGMECVFHCAADTSGALVMRDNPIAHLTGNILINSQMLAAASAEKVERFLFVSSSTIYPASAALMREEQAFEGEPFDAYFGVGWMKRYIEKLAEYYHRRMGLKFALMRPTNVYGPHDKFDPERSHVLPALIRRAVAGENPLEVWGDGTAVRDFIYVDDMVHAMLAALAKTEGALAVNFATGRSVTIKEAAELILKCTGSAARVAFDPSKPTTIPARRLDLSRAEKVLGFKAQVPFEEGLKRTIKWYKSTLEFG